jgi:tRNA wybutosine-synthesizing protein 1
MRKLKNFIAQIDLSYVDLDKWKAERMYAQGYRFVGKHSAVKVCEWAKKSIRSCANCYKQQFYGINSHQCVQMSPAAFFCDLNCLHCWRSLNFTLPRKNFVWDSPELIVDGCIKEHIKYIQGFGGRKIKIKSKTMKEAKQPKHFAISLSGEPTLYPYLPEMIDIIKQRKMTAFLVTNGAHPEMIEKLLDHQPTNLYVTLAAPDKSLFKKECCPMISDGWERLQKSLSLLKKFECNTVIRLTLNRNNNMLFPKQYAKIIELAQPKFVEVKGYVAVGGAREKMGVPSMPYHKEIVEFAKDIEKNSKYKIIDEKPDSRVVLLKKQTI